MLSMSKPLNAQSAEKYYDRDNYYLESQGQWYGKLSHDLNVSGEIQKEDFSNLLRGFSVENNEKLVKSAGQTYQDGTLKHRSGIDLTFSAPKSVSVLSYADDRIEHAFHRALHSTLDHAEQEFTQTRHKKKGKISFESTEKALFSTFTHRTSRELDPQLHAHCVMFNLTKSHKSDKIMTIHNDQFYKNKMYLGQHFRNNLASELQNIGYQVEITDRKQGFFEVKGVGKDVIDAFSKRSDQVKNEINHLRTLKYSDLTKRFSELDGKTQQYLASKELNIPLNSSGYEVFLSKKIVEMTDKNDLAFGNQLNSIVESHVKSKKGFDNYSELFNKEYDRLSKSDSLVFSSFNDSELAALAKTNSRVSKKNVTKEFILNEINKTCQQLDTSLSEIVETAQHQVNFEKELKRSSDIVMQAVSGITENHATFTKHEVINKALKFSIGGYSYTEIKSAYDDLLASGDLVFLGKNETSAGINHMYTSRHMKYVEGKIIDMCRESVGSTDVKIDREVSEAFINETDVKLKINDMFSLNESNQVHADTKFLKTIDSIESVDLRKRLTQLRDEALGNKKNPSESVQKIKDEIQRFPELKEIVEKNGRGFTKGQKDMLSQVVSSKCQFSVVQGDSGTGKSFAAQYANILLKKNGFTVRGLAPTGVVADALAQEAGLEYSSTLDGFIKKFQLMEETDKASTFRKGKECFILDEAGMVGSENVYTLMKIADELEAKVVFVGDRKQFQSISAGRIFSDLQDKSGIDMCVMQDVMRQKTQQTKDIVASISSKDYTAAFNYLSGYSDAEKFDKSKAKNYKKGQLICFNDEAIAFPANTVAQIEKVEGDSLLVSYTAKQFENNKLVEKKYKISFNPSENNEYEHFRVFDSSELSKNPYQNTIKEIDDDAKRLHTVSMDYLQHFEEGKEVVVITPTNDERKKINSIIFDSLVEKGYVQSKGNFTLREPLNLDGMQSRFSDSYRVGQVVIANHQTGAMDRGCEGRIIEVNSFKNEITIEYSTEGRTSTITINVSDNAGTFSVFNEIVTPLGINDQITFLKNDTLVCNDENLKIRNGQLATITAIDDKGNITARIGKEGEATSKSVTFNVNGEGRNKYNYATHAYCLSEFKAQGKSVSTVLWNANANKNINANSFYVSVTRCKDEVSIYTNNEKKLREKAVVEQEKESTLDYSNFNYTTIEAMEKDAVRSFDHSFEQKQEDFTDLISKQIDEHIEMNKPTITKDNNRGLDI